MRTLAELSRHLNLAAGRRRSDRLPRLILLSDDQRLPDPEPLLRRLPHGSLVILRAYRSAEQRARQAARLARLCRAHRLAFSVAGDVGLALALGSGLHLPEGLARQAGPRLRLWHRRRQQGGRGAAPPLLTVAAHGRRALRQAARLGADAALLSPVFVTASHPDARPLGPLAFRRLARRAPLPVYALGGITAGCLGLLAGSRAAGVATVGGLTS